MSPSIDKVMTVDRLGMRDGPRLHAAADIWALGRRLRAGRFDVALDCHGFRESSLMAWWSGAPRRLGLKRFDQAYLGFCFNLPPVLEDKSLHASQMFLRLVQPLAPENAVIAPQASSLQIPPEAREWADGALPQQPYAAFYIDAPVPERRWPQDRFAAVARHMRQARHLRVVVINGGTEISPEIFGDDVTLIRQPSIPQLSAAIASARVLVSNDTGPLHLGPAFGVPTLGIFSVGLPQHFRPTGVHDDFVQGNPIDKVGEEEVIQKLERILEHSDR